MTCEFHRWQAGQTIELPGMQFETTWRCRDCGVEQRRTVSQGAVSLDTQTGVLERQMLRSGARQKSEQSPGAWLRAAQADQERAFKERQSKAITHGHELEERRKQLRHQQTVHKPSIVCANEGCRNCIEAGERLDAQLNQYRVTALALTSPGE